MAITDMEMADLMREVCHAGGVGPLVLGGPLPGFRAFAAALEGGATFPYVIQGVAYPGQWEAGVGEIDGAGRLVRMPQASSAGGGAVDFAVGEKHVGLALHAGWVAQVNDHGHGPGEIDGLEAALAGKQAASGELSAIAALTTSGFGRGALTMGDGAAFRAYIGAGTSSAGGTVTSVAAGGGMAFATIGAAGNVALGTPSSVTLGSTNGVAAGTHSHAFAPGGSSAQYLRGDGSLATFPAGSALSKVDDSNVTLTLGGGAASALLNAASITLGWAGQLPVARGGTGAASLTGYVKGNGAAAFAASATIPHTDITGLGSASTYSIGTGGAAVPLLDGSNIWSAQQLFTTARINSAGTDSSISFGSFNPNFQMYGTSVGGSSIGLSTFQANANGPIMFFAKARDGLGVYTTPISAGDLMGGYSFYGADGTSLVNGALLEVRSGTAFSSTNRETFFQFRVQPASATGSVPVVLQVRATDTRPGADNALSLGTASSRWSVVYAASGAINTSDARAKCDVGPVDEALLDAWANVAWGQYRFVEAVAEKGDDARWHLGLVAQQVRDAIDAQMGAGAAVRWGLVCHDRWDAEPALQDEDGGVLHPARAAGDRWGLRYDECFALEALWQRRAIAGLAARLDALDAGGGDAGG